MELKIAVFGSGKGSNFRSILNFIQQKRINAVVKIVISNISTAGILEIARGNNIPAFHISHKQFQSEDEFSENIINTLENHDVNFIVLAGYLKKIPSSIIHKFKNRIINIHPALIPSFCGENMYGSKVHQAVLEYGCKVTGVTIHIVDEEYDRGPIILQKCIDVEESDTLQSLSERVLKVEHETYPEALRLFADDRVVVNGRKVGIKKVLN